jgi:glycosyltransferase involved in cell wall biosynthesis
MSGLKSSVIISTYNRPAYLERVLEGYLLQTTPPGEIIVADDGSTEETAALIRRFRAESAVDIRHVWHEDKGFRLAAIRNRAIAAGAGEYLIFADDDAVPSKRFVEDHLRFAEAHCFIQGHRVMLGKEISATFSVRDSGFASLLSPALRGRIGNVINALRPPAPLIKRSQDMKGIRGCNMSFYRADLLAVNGFNEDFVGWGKEDSELAVRLYRNGVWRKDLKFRACCFHLYHDNYGRDKLEHNIGLLEAARKDTLIYCANGVDKYLT